MRNGIIWACVAVYAVYAAVNPFLLGTPLEELAPAIAVFVPLAFVLAHGPREIGWKLLCSFFAIAFAISWAYESLSITTGFPFGNYHYSDDLGIKLGAVPLLIMPAYFVVCYVSWMIASLILGQLIQAPRRPDLFPQVLVASLVMVMWDLAMDPMRATVGRVWIWEDGGAYFGVPLQNFAGWFLCVATIFYLYGLLHSKSGKPRMQPDRTSLAQAQGLCAAIFLEFVSRAMFPRHGVAVDATQKAWDIADMFQSMGLVACFTMGFVITLGSLALRAQGQWRRRTPVAIARLF